MTLSVLSVALLFAGCASRRPGMSPATPWPPDFDLNAALSRLANEASRPVLFDGVLRVSGRHQGERLRARAIAVVEPGGRLYLESVGRPSFILASDGEEVRVLFAEEREWLRGPATAATVEALIGLPLTPEELGALLADVAVTPTMLASARDLGRGRLEVAGGELELDAVSGRVRAGRLRGLTFAVDQASATTHLTLHDRELELTLRRAGGGTPAARAVDLFRPQPEPSFRELDLDLLMRPVLLPRRERR